MSVTGSDLFITNFKTVLKRVFHEQNNINDLSHKRGLPPEVWNNIMDAQPLSVSIPLEYGGRGCSVKECLNILSVASYESLPLSLTLGINIALFLEPLSKYADLKIKEKIFPDFLNRRCMGGLMITEPEYGSDALNMRTAYHTTENGYSIKGRKHWQGLTGQANYWIVAARKAMGDNLARDIDFFVVDNAIPEQHIQVESIFSNLGLYMIPYGLNIIDIEVPAHHRLKPEGTGIKMMLDILHRSRMQFPGMAMGFINRMLDEALLHCRNRVVGAGNLLMLDAVQFQLSRIQTAFTICSGMCARSSGISSIDNNLANEGLEANTMKTLVTDLMQEAAQLCLQVSGASGYKVSHIAGRGIVDSRAFQIFEGSNEMLYTQIAETVLKLMKKNKERSLYSFLLTFNLTNKSTPYFKDQLQFVPGENIPQRKQVELGKIIARVISIQYVLALDEEGFRKDLIDNCILNIQRDIAHLTSDFCIDKHSKLVEEYKEDCNWLDFV